MQTKISKNNPFGPDRYGFLWEALRPLSVEKHIDYGAYDGRVIRTLVDTGCVQHAVGVDVNKKVVSKNRHLMPDGVELHLVERGKPLPFEDDTFDSASLLDVLEHVADQEAVLSEIRRVLKPGGRLIVTVPGKHLFSFLDTGNFKFRFPQLHRFLYLMRHSEADYYLRYVDNPDGLIGDIEREKAWHEHFSPTKLRGLLALCGFQAISFDGSGFFARLILPLRLISPGMLGRMWERVLDVDARLFGRTNLFCMAVLDDIT